MTSFAEIVDAAYQLDASEQTALVEILNRQLYEKRKAELLNEVSEARKEYAEGKAEFTTSSELIKELRDEA